MQGAKVPTRSQRYQTPYAFLLVSYMPLASRLVPQLVPGSSGRVVYLWRRASDTLAAQQRYARWPKGVYIRAILEQLQEQGCREDRIRGARTH